MKVGVARESAPGERRVALVPEALAKLTAAGIFVIHASPQQIRTEPDRIVRDIAAALRNARPAAAIRWRPAVG